MTGVVLGYIPSPSNGTFSLGPLTLHMYGVMLLLAIAACIWLTGKRWVTWGGDWDLVFRVALWLGDGRGKAAQENTEYFVGTSPTIRIIRSGL